MDEQDSTLLFHKKNVKAKVALSQYNLTLCFNKLYRYNYFEEISTYSGQFPISTISKEKINCKIKLN